MKAFLKYILAMISFSFLLSCGRGEEETIPIVSWGGVDFENFDRLLPMVKESGIDIHLSRFRNAQDAAEGLDMAAGNGLMAIVGCPEIKDDTGNAVAALKTHPALYAYNLKDEPEVWDIGWLSDLAKAVASHDPEHPSYINLYPNWAWGNEKYSEHIEMFADKVDVPFYSFDQYPVRQLEDGSISVRPTWYENLELVSELARRRGRPFWAFAMTWSHSIGAPSPPAHYPVPTIGHLRLQVYSDLLYGAQAIQYFTFRGLYDAESLEKTEVFGIVKEMNSEIKAFSRVFHGCDVKGIWHIGEEIPTGTCRLDEMPDSRIESIGFKGKEGGLVSLLNKDGKTYLSVQNKDCTDKAALSIIFNSRARLLSPDGSRRFKNTEIILTEGNVAIFEL